MCRGEFICVGGAGFPQAPKERRRALDVGEEKREGRHRHSVEGPAKPPQRARWSEGRIRRTVCVMPEPDEEPRPGPEGAFVSNWTTYDAPFVAKLRMAASNTFIKLRKRQACCGNHGQPGC